mgnify:CR=1 FL=1
MSESAALLLLESTQSVARDLRTSLRHLRHITVPAMSLFALALQDYGFRASLKGQVLCCLTLPTVDRMTLV